jgi:MYXO-CTERM domain-containing protein
MGSLTRSLTSCLLALFFAPTAWASEPDVLSTPGTDPEAVVGGFPSATCAWPTTVSMQGMCTGTLIHPQLVIYAAHCGNGYSSVQFGESGDNPQRSVSTEFCRTFPGGGPGGGNDFAFCKLAEPVLDVPIVPALMGCETDLLVPGAEVTVVGFGFDENDGYGVKREVVTTINNIDQNNEIFIGGNGKDSCNGDSGGPVFIKHPSDGSWRVFGITSYGGQCGTGGYYSMMHIGMDWFETESGLDLTPCFDAAGTWTPGGGCVGFPLDPGIGGDWATGCGGGPVSGPSTSCGAPPTPDEVPPTAVITAPIDGTEYDAPMGADVTIAVDAQDVGGWGVKEVHILINGQEVPGGIDNAPPYELNAKFPTGEYEIGALAIDNAGNMANALPVTIYVNTPIVPETTSTGEDTDESGEGTGESGGGEGETGTGEGEGGATEPTSGGATNPTSPTNPTGATSLTGASTTAGEDEDSGCGCRSGQDPKASLLALVGLGALLRRRRR